MMVISQGRIGVTLLFLIPGKNPNLFFKISLDETDGVSIIRFSWKGTSQEGMCSGAGTVVGT